MATEKKRKETPIFNSMKSNNLENQKTTSFVASSVEFVEYFKTFCSATVLDDQSETVF